jgi:hypothetical protein
MLYRKNLHSILWYPTTIIREKTFFIESVRVWYEKYKQNYKVVITDYNNMVAMISGFGKGLCVN